MTQPTRTPKQTVLRRLFIAQIGLVLVLTAVAVAVHERLDTGSFWPSLLMGCLGGSVGLLRRIRSDDARAIDAAGC